MTGADRLLAPGDGWAVEGLAATEIEYLPRLVIWGLPHSKTPFRFPPADHRPPLRPKPRRSCKIGVSLPLGRFLQVERDEARHKRIWPHRPPLHSSHRPAWYTTLPPGQYDVHHRRSHFQTGSVTASSLGNVAISGGTFRVPSWQPAHTGNVLTSRVLTGESRRLSRAPWRASAARGTRKRFFSTPGHNDPVRVSVEVTIAVTVRSLLRSLCTGGDEQSLKKPTTY